jgi:ribosomal-protein-alanine acetyltransferase
VISEAKPGDLADIMELEREGFPARERWSEQAWGEEIGGEGRCVLVHRGDDGRLIGVVVGSVQGDTAEIFRVVVAQDHRRLGVGRSLMVGVLDWACEAGAERVLLEVRADNEDAIALYKSFGFETLSFRADYYGPGSDAIVLAVSVAIKPGGCQQ